MDRKHIEIIRSNHVCLSKDLTVDEEFFSYFLQKRVLTDANVEEIMVIVSIV